jgi:dTDP-glucose pyrophosphorylase
MQIQILMPMAGAGTRFQAQGYTDPKPLINVLGKPIFSHALDSYSKISSISKYFFVVRRSHLEKQIIEKISEVVRNPTFIITDIDTYGAADTALLAEGQIDLEKPLIVADCDILFTSSEFYKTILDPRNTKQCVLMTFQSQNPNFSYLEYGQNGEVVCVREKQLISSTAIVGAYYFNKAYDFYTAAKQVREKYLSKKIGEMYISNVINELLRGGASIAQVNAKFISLGTPEELDEYLRNIK